MDAKKLKKKPEAIKFRKDTLEAIRPKDGERPYYFDTEVRGLAVAITPKGIKSFYVYKRVNGTPKRIFIGHFPDLSVEQARNKARELLGRIATGEDPTEDEQQPNPDMTLEEMLMAFTEDKKAHGRKTWEDDRRQFDRYLADKKSLKASEFSREDMKTLHLKIGSKEEPSLDAAKAKGKEPRRKPHTGKYAANRLLALIRAMYNFGLNERLIKCENPAAGIKRFDEVSRDRRLFADELPQFWKAVAEEPNETIRDYVLISLLTGARKSNVLSMMWSDLYFERKIWRIPMTKNGTPQDLPLPTLAIEILEGRKERSEGLKEENDYVFPSYGKSGHLAEPKAGWKRILDRAGLKDVRLHDLRRTLGSWQVDTGASLAIVGKTLNHKSQAATAVYARVGTDPQRESMERATSAMLKAALKQEEAGA